MTATKYVVAHGLANLVDPWGQRLPKHERTTRNTKIHNDRRHTERKRDDNNKNKLNATCDIGVLLLQPLCGDALATGHTRKTCHVVCCTTKAAQNKTR